MVSTEYQEHQGPTVLRGFRVLMALRVQRDRREFRASQDPKVQRDRPDLRVPKDRRDESATSRLGGMV
jgi:hypothetical protein